MRRALFALFFMLLFVQHSVGQTSLETTTISLITGSPGADLYNTFGHSAIRIKDPVRGIDFVYNYGTFDFSAPNFYLNFTRGKLDYMLSTEPTENLRYGFLSENRSMAEQVLNLSEEQKRLLIGRLQDNYKPESRYYKYDFFFDNCATRVRDIINIGLDSTIVFNYSSVDSTLRFRDLIHPYIVNLPWTHLGISIGLGSPTDRISTPYEQMFLPEIMVVLPWSRK